MASQEQPPSLPPSPPLIAESAIPAASPRPPSDGRGPPGVVVRPHVVDEVRRHPEPDAAARARVAHETHSGGGGGGAVRGRVDCRRGGRRRRGLLGRIVKLPAKKPGVAVEGSKSGHEFAPERTQQVRCHRRVKVSVGNERGGYQMGDVSGGC